MRSLIDLYRHEPGMGSAVWQRLMLKGDLLQGGSDWEEAYAVAVETMSRVRRNLERILDFLRGSDYLFGTEPGSDPDPRAAWLPPTPETKRQLERLESIAGPIPLSLRTWWEIVGSVSLQGVFPQFLAPNGFQPMSDPLVVAPLNEVLLEIDESLLGAEEDDCQDEGLPLVIAPDIFHKADVSGGAPYEVRAPDRRADAPILNVVILLANPPGAAMPYTTVETRETFVEYLRRSFQWAGFPGYAFLPDPQMDLIRPLFKEMAPL